jgi:hypothetical protein
MATREKLRVVVPNAAYFGRMRGAATTTVTLSEHIADDLSLSKVGLIFCCSISVAVFVVALVALPVDAALPHEVDQIGTMLNPTRGHLAGQGLVAAPSMAGPRPTPGLSSPTPAPRPSVAVMAPRTPPPSPVPDPVLEPVKRPAPPVASKAGRYVVRPGDTLYSVARQGISPQAASG